MASGLPILTSNRACGKFHSAWGLFEIPSVKARMMRCRRFWGLTLLGSCVLAISCAGTLCAQETNRKLLKQVEPEYPRVLKKMEIGGIVRLKLTIKPDGSVSSSEVLGGNPILATEAQKAVAQWKFAPASSTSTAEVKLVFDPHK
jgi:TonB family protein